MFFADLLKIGRMERKPRYLDGPMRPITPAIERPPISERTPATNRRNEQRWTGPRTARGDARALSRSRNSRPGGTPRNSAACIAAAARRPPPARLKNRVGPNLQTKFRRIDTGDLSGTRPKFAERTHRVPALRLRAARRVRAWRRACGWSFFRRPAPRVNAKSDRPRLPVFSEPSRMRALRVALCYWCLDRLRFVS